MRTRETGKLVWLGLAVAFTLTLASVASAQPGELVKGVLQPLADGFPNKPITLINTDEPGSQDGVYGRVMQAGLKGISPVDIRISDEPTASWGTFVRLKEVLTREGGADGYYPIIISLWGMATDPLTEPITEQTGMDISDPNGVIITEATSYVIVQRKDAPWGRTWADLVKYAKANPNKLRRTTSTIGSGTDIMTRWVEQQAGIKVQVIPQPSMEVAVTAVAAGAADYCGSPSFRTQPHLEAGRLNMLMIMSPKVPPPWDKDPNVISMVQAGLPETPIGMLFGFVVNKQVPTAHVNWLYKLFRTASETTVNKQRAKTVLGFEPMILDPAQTNALKYKYYELADPLVRSVGIHVDQRKK